MVFHRNVRMKEGQTVNDMPPLELELTTLGL